MLPNVAAPVATKVWWLYMIECEGGSIYTGITTDVEARFKTHCAGKGARYTRMYLPIRLLAFQEFPNVSEAAKAERSMKKRTAEFKRKWAAQFSLGVMLAETGA